MSRRKYTSGWKKKKLEEFIQSQKDTIESIDKFVKKKYSSYENSRIENLNKLFIYIKKAHFNNFT